jgi:hypothetical protein
LQADFLAGNGIGRYGSAELPDVTVKPTGILAPIPEIQALVGLVGHPTGSIDLYACAGVEQASSTAFTVHGTLPFGHGNLLYKNSGCLHEGSTVCAANTERVWQITNGFWWDGLHRRLRQVAGRWSRFIHRAFGLSRHRGWAEHQRGHFCGFAPLLPFRTLKAIQAAATGVNYSGGAFSNLGLVAVFGPGPI